MGAKYSTSTVYEKVVTAMANWMYLTAEMDDKCTKKFSFRHNDVIMGAMAFQTISLMVVYLTIFSDADPRKHQSSASLAFVRGIFHRWPVNSPHKWPVMRKMFPFDDVIMFNFTFWRRVTNTAEDMKLCCRSQCKIKKKNTQTHTHSDTYITTHI